VARSAELRHPSTRQSRTHSQENQKKDTDHDEPGDKQLPIVFILLLCAAETERSPAVVSTNRVPKATACVNLFSLLLSRRNLDAALVTAGHIPLPSTGFYAVKKKKTRDAYPESRRLLAQMLQMLSLASIQNPLLAARQNRGILRRQADTVK
jgi:hypothetical protein